MARRHRWIVPTATCWAIGAGLLFFDEGAVLARQDRPKVFHNEITEFLPFPEGSTRGFLFSNDQDPENGYRVGFVNTSAGNLTFQWIDLMVPGPIPLPVGRVYDSARASEVDAGAAGDFGPGWRLEPGGSIEWDGVDAALTYVESGGRRVQLARAQPAGAFLPVEGEATGVEKVVAAAGAVLVRRADGVTLRFLPAGERGRYLLAEQTDPVGHWVRFIREQDRLSRIETSGGDVVLITRRADARRPRGQRAGPGRVVAIQVSGGKRIHYIYRHGQLAAVKREPGLRFRVGHDPFGRVVSVEGPDGGMQFVAAYGASGRVTRFETVHADRSYSFDDATRITTVTDGGGRGDSLLARPAGSCRGDRAGALGARWLRGAVRSEGHLQCWRGRG